MKIFTSIPKALPKSVEALPLTAWHKTRHELAYQTPLGFVPTMGNLHEGHAALIKQSIHENPKTVVSIFVNPTQFNQAADFENYPKTLEQDLSLLKSLGVDYCIIPDKDAMYPDEFRYQIHEVKESLPMEGAHRPGHFTGVLTIVMKLFQLTKPARAYFGEKDYQQLTLVQGMIDAFFMEIELRPCPIVRDANGLALSSRNSRLTQEGYKRACEFARVFKYADSCEEVQEKLKAQNITVEYIKTYQNRRFAAVEIEGVRLIDNYVLD